MLKNNLFKKLGSFIKYQKNTIRVKLFITYFVINIILITGIGAFSYGYSSKSSQENIQRSNLEIIDQINKNLESNFQQIKNIMLIPYNNSDYITGVSLYSEMSDWDKANFKSGMSQSFYRSFYNIRRSDLENFYLYSNDGSILFTSSGINENIETNEFMNLDWVKKTIKKNGGIYFNSAREETVRGSKELIFSTSIMIKDISRIANFSIVKADFNFDEISKIFSNDVIGKKSETILVDATGRVIYSTGNRVITSYFDKNIISKIRNNNGTFWAKTSGIEYLVSYAKSEISGWNIIYMIPKADIFDASIKIRNMTIYISIIGLILTAIISFIFSLQITKPLLKLNKMITSVKKGDLSIRMEGKNEDEIGRIYSTFNALIVEVNSLIETKYVYQIKEREYELNLLYAQINPHFIYNTLDTIRTMADIKEIDNVSQMITLLADMLRYSVRNINAPVTVKQELDHIEQYLTICRIRFGKKVDFSIEVDQSIMSYKISRLILQPIIENCIHHGRHIGKKKLFITLTGARKDDTIVFTIKDNGIGMDENTLMKVREAFKLEVEAHIGDVKEGSIGLVNINSRLRILYGEREFIKVSSWEGIGTDVQLSIPVQVSE